MEPRVVADMAATTPAYQTLETRFRRLGALREAADMLHWDLSTMMPAGGAHARAEQLATLAVVCHELLTDPTLADLLAQAAEESTSMDAWRQANLREMRRQWLHATAVEGKLVEAMSKATQRCERIWRKARACSDFAMVLPSLKNVVALVREAAVAKADLLGCAPYDALLDEYEPSCTSARVDAILEPLAEALPGLLARVLKEQSRRRDPLKLPGPFPARQQEALGRRLMELFGFDFSHGRLDVSLHPFCGGVPDDVRITTRYDEAEFVTALMGVLHETGHALYERGLPKGWRLQPVGRAAGMAMHESQSLLIEMQVCRGREFLSFLAPLMRQEFGGTGEAWEADNLVRLYNQVEPSLIRVEADEVTYPAHVILRYRLEKQLVAGELEPEDLPGAWNEAMTALLDLTPPDDQRGCLQDIHWYDGAWGYFPTYTLGAVGAAQLYDAAKQAISGLHDAIKSGNFASLIAWLRKHVHSWGALYTLDDLLVRITGNPLDPRIFLKHLESRYLGQV